jgi:hypothetical protein
MHSRESSRDVSPPCQIPQVRGVPTAGVEGEQPDGKPPKIKVKRTRGGSLDIDMEPIDVKRLLSAFGTAEPGFASLMLIDVINAACAAGPANLKSGDIDRALAAVTGIAARDETEAMLATQMVATHAGAIRALQRLRGSKTVAQQDSNGNLAIKLLRTFTMQLEALHRYRGKGQQKVTVEHVHVNAGGQAIVGTVQRTAVKKCKKPM